jgi:NADPH:quinone reductase
MDPRDTMSREADIRGMSLGNATEGELQGVHAALRAALDDGTLRPVIATVLPLSEAAAAHCSVLDAHPPGKIVLTP